MKNRTPLFICLILLVVVSATACRTSAVELRYLYRIGSTSTYTWTLTSESLLETSLQTIRRETVAQAKVDETVVSVGRDGNASIRTVVTITSISRDGVSLSPEGRVTSVTRVTPQGRVVRFQSSDADSETPVGDLDLDRLSSEFRPILPIGLIEIGDTWSTPLRLSASGSSVALDGNGRLGGFELAARKRLASLEFKRSGDVSSNQSVGRTQLALEGDMAVSGTALIDIDRGEVYRSSSTSRSNFAVSITGSGEVGILNLVLKSTVTKRQDL